MRSVITLCLFVFVFLQVQSSNRNIMPYPASFQFSEGMFQLTEDLEIGIEGPNTKTITHAIKRLHKGIAYRTRLNINNPVSYNSLPTEGISITYNQGATPEINTDESYHLVVEQESIKLSAQTDIGVLRGVETLLQLIKNGDSIHSIPCVDIKDAPKFKWRGLLMDVSRHFIPIDVIKRNLDAMAAVKINILHLHIADDQGWRMESLKYPALQTLASNGDFYTQNQIKDLVEYANTRGISIVPEIDIPGHSSAFLKAFPQLASKDEAQEISRTFGIMKPVINPIKEETYTVLTNIFREVDALFPGKYIHIGGDEVKADHWNSNSEIKSFMSKNGYDAHALQNYFLQRVADSLQQFNRQIIGWDEIFTDGLSKDAIVHCWRNKEVAAQASKNGYKTIISHGFYLDLMYPAVKHYYNPVNTTGLTKDQKANLLGGEACMWSELVDRSTMDSRIWPRLGAVAENLWSPDKALNKKDLNVRLHHLAISLNEFKLTHQSAGYGILHEISGSGDIIALAELKGICEPITGYQRHGSYPYTTSTPLNSFADAVVVDALMIAPFAKAVDEFIISGKNQENFDFIADKLYEWAGFYEYYESYFNSTPELQILAPLAMQLSDAAKLADEALEMSVKGKIPKTDWIENAKKVLKDAKTPVEGVKLSIIVELERLMSFSKDHDVIEF